MINNIIMSSKLSPVFNKHFMEFLDDVSTIFPDNVDILTAKNGIVAMKKVNPTMLIKIWHQYIATPYLQQIMDGDIQFFISKDYTEDLSNTDNAAKILAAINRLRDPIKQMMPDDQQKSMKYIQNLTKLSVHYHEK